MKPTVADMMRLIERLYPICRSITGDGVRETLSIIGEHIPLQLHEVPTGTPVLDWTVPKEWNIRDAWIKDVGGTRVVDFQKHNLHVVNYSVPVHKKMTRSELRPYLHTLPDHPEWIPYRTSYYKETWGFCLSQRQLDAMPEGTYDVCIDSTLSEGALTYGECVIKGASDREILISAHVCHPSLANDNLSGIVLATLLAKSLAEAPAPPRYSYRFLFAPGTIGAITWIARNREGLDRVAHGLVLALVGDAGALTYKKTRDGNTRIDRVMEHVLKRDALSHAIEAFTPYGYDERQYNSPGVHLPVGRLTRSPNGGYPEYHSSADNVAFVKEASLLESLAVVKSVLEILETEPCYVNTQPMGEPQLGKRGLYDKAAGTDARGREMAMLWLLNLCDGDHSLREIAEVSGVERGVIESAAKELLAAKLLTDAR